MIDSPQMEMVSNFWGGAVVFFAFTCHVVGGVVGSCVSQGGWGKGGGREMWDGDAVNSSDRGL